MRPPVGIDLPGRDQARQAAQRELSKPGYRAAEPPWYARVLRWLAEQLGSLFDRVSASMPSGWALVLLVVLLVGLAALIALRVRPAGRRAVLGGEFGTSELTAQEHRASAQAAAARGEYAEAVREQLRAVVRDLEVRGVLEPRPARTADEIAADAGAALPALTRPLAEAARLFDDVWYGGRPADAATFARMVALDGQVGATRLVTA